MVDAGRKEKFRDAALILADDLVRGAARLKRHIANGEYSMAESLAAKLQTDARDVKWLMRRQPKASEDRS